MNLPPPMSPKHKFPHRASPNQDTDIKHMPLNTNAMNPLPALPPQESSTNKQSLADGMHPGQTGPTMSLQTHNITTTARSAKGEAPTSSVPPSPSSQSMWRRLHI
ncbi:hypothetical protein AMECASPLE_017116 [Ameca splendens]|uniref:Uncharacterized protein n=1 Tax=Ameca splendens TaxID=208324 RepID=A0ABV0YDR7_9TELE